MKIQVVSNFNLTDSFLLFSGFSGMRLNPAKSQGFFCSMDDSVTNDILQKYGFTRGTLPINYLCLPLITSRLNEQLCSPLIQKLCWKIESWSVRCLRYSGRLQLISSVLQGIHGYWASYLFLPKGVIKRVQSLFARFLWGGSLDRSCHYKVAWADCCSKKQEGGLGIRDMFEWNKTAIFLQIWRLSQPHPTSLWILWVHSCLLKNKAFWTAKIPYKCPWNVRKILNARLEALQFISFKVSQQSVFKAWHDPWLTNSPLISRLGTGIISVMESSSDAPVSSLIANGQWRVAISNDYRAVTFRNLLSNFIIGDKDLVLWNGDSSQKMSVVWESFRHRPSPKAWIPLLWHKFHIPACSFISWLACRERLLTKDRMRDFHMEVDPKCVLCRSYNEDTGHLFTACPYTYILLRNCPFALNLNWDCWLRGDFFPDDLTRFQQRLAFLYINIVIYLVWHERNARIHEQGVMDVSQMGQKIKRMFREKLFTCDGFKRKLLQDPTLARFLY